ncbi:hypothetical protein E0494_05890 [Marinilabiliaceae bacterium JC040]|nr:hypothetical protein [Marinilabiliaceae bacterium JC040]
MNQFLSEISKIKNRIKVINITWQDINHIKTSILKEQNLKNLNELRDRFEGIAYYEAIYKKIAGVIALEKILKRRIIDWENIKPKEYKPIIEISGTKYLVITTIFGDLPTIPKNNKLPIILTIAKEEKIIWAIGILNINDFSSLFDFSTYIDIDTITDSYI